MTQTPDYNSKYRKPQINHKVIKKNNLRGELIILEFCIKTPTLFHSYYFSLLYYHIQFNVPSFENMMQF